MAGIDFRSLLPSSVEPLFEVIDEHDINRFVYFNGHGQIDRDLQEQAQRARKRVAEAVDKVASRINHSYLQVLRFPELSDDQLLNAEAKLNKTCRDLKRWSRTFELP